MNANGPRVTHDLTFQSEPKPSLSLPPRADYPAGLTFAKFALAYATMSILNRTGAATWVSVQFSLSRKDSEGLVHFLVIAALFGAYFVFHSWQRGWKVPRLVLERTAPAQLTEGVEMPEIGIKASFTAWLMAPVMLFALSAMLAFTVLGAPRPPRGADFLLGAATACGVLALYFLRSGSRMPLSFSSQGARVKGHLLRWDEVARVELEPREVLSEYTATRWSFFNQSSQLIGRVGIPKMQCSQALENQMIRACAQALHLDF